MRRIPSTTGSASAVRAAGRQPGDPAGAVRLAPVGAAEHRGVDAARERAALADHDQRAQVARIGEQRPAERAQLVPHLQREAVELVRTVEHQPSDVPVAFEADRLELGPRPWSRRYGWPATGDVSMRTTSTGSGRTRDPRVPTAAPTRPDGTHSPSSAVASTSWGSARSHSRGREVHRRRRCSRRPRRGSPRRRRCRHAGEAPPRARRSGASARGCSSRVAALRC